MQESRGSSEAVYLDVALLNLEPKPLVLRLKVPYLAFEYRCLAVTSRKVLHEQPKPVALNEQRVIFLNKSLHDD